MWDRATPVTNPDAPQAGRPLVGNPPPAVLGGDLSLGPPIPELDLLLPGGPLPAPTPLNQGNAPAGSEGPAWKIGTGILRFGTEVGGELIGQKLLGPAKGATGLYRLGRNALSAGIGGASGSVLNQTALRPSQAGVPPPSIDEIGRNAVTTGLQAAAGEGVAAGVAKGWNKLKGAIGETRFGRPMADRMTDDGREAEAYLGGQITPGQATENYTVNAIESLLKSTPLGGGRFRKFFTEQEALLKEKARELLDKFGPRRTVEEAGTTIRGGLEKTAREVESAGAAKVNPLRAQESAQFGVAGQSAQEALEHRRSILQAVGPARTPEDTGKVWQALQDAAEEAERKTTRGLYKAVDEVAEDVRVPLDSIRGFVEEEMTRRGKLGMAMAPGQVKGPANEILRATTPDVSGEVVEDGWTQALRNVAEGRQGQTLTSGTKNQIGGRPELMDEVNEILADADAKLAVNEAGEIAPLTFEQAHSVRSSIGRRIRIAEKSTDANAKHSLGFLKQLYAKMDDAMTEAAGGLDSEVRTTYDAAGAAWKKMADTFERGLLADVAKEDPRLVVDALIQKGSVDDILKAQRAVGKEGWKAIQASHLDTLLRDPATGGWASPQELRKRLTALKPETVEAIYGKPTAHRITDYVKMQMSADALGELGAQTGKQATALATATAKEAEIIRRKIPEAFEALAATLKNNDSAGAQKLRTLVGDDDWPAVQSAYLQKLLFKPGTEELRTGEKILTDLYKASAPMLKEVFPGGKAEGIWQFARVLHQVQKRQPGSHFAQVSGPFMQVGAGVAAVTGNWNRRIGTLLMAPPVLARIILSPTGRQLLTTGLKEAKDAAPGMANRALSQLATWAAKEGLIDAAETGRPGPPQATVPQAPQTGRGAGPGPRAGQPPPLPTIPQGLQ